MATRAPAVRKHLSADALLNRLRTGFGAIAEELQAVDLTLRYAI